MQFKRDTIFFSALVAGIVLMSCESKKVADKSPSLKIPGVSYRTYEGKIGERTTVLLADSSSVILNSASKIEVPDSFGTGSRELILDGDAFFNVKPGKDSFVVITDKLRAALLGKSFRMRSFASQHGATLYLLEGRLKVGKSYYSATDNQPEILERGQMVLANNEIDLMEKETFHPEELEAWLSDSLVLKNVTAMQLARVLEDWYGVEVIVSGDGSKTPNADQTFVHATLQEVLNQLSAAMHFSYKIKGDGVKIELE